MIKSLSATEFEMAMKVEVPQKVRQFAGRVYFDVLTQTDEAMVKGPPGIPVDTGYLRASRTFTVGDESPAPMDPREPNGDYRAQNASITSAARRAVAQFLPLTIGFRASYGHYVEDKVGFVKTAYARVGQFLRLAIRNAQGASRGGV